MPGASGASSAIAGERQRLPEHALRSASRGRPPGRSRVGSPRQATMVDSTPTGVGPPSTIRSMRPRRSASTCAAVVGETWPERLADGATTGPPNAASKRCATGWSGTRTAMCRGRRSARSATGQSGALRQHQRQRAGPERVGQLLGRGIEAARGVRAASTIRDMRDQRIEARAGPWRRRAARPPRRWWRRRRARRRSRSETRPARRRARQRAAAAIASRFGLHHPRSRLGGHRLSRACGFKGAGVIRPPTVGV